jgi:phage tail-like protein
MSDERPNEVSSYLTYLPALFQEVGPDGTSGLGRFLLAFEEVLTGLGGAARPGLEEILDGTLKKTGQQTWAPDPETGVQRYFTPGPGDVPDDRRAPKEFLEWLADWVALTLQPGWGDDEKRRLLARIVPLYAKRGTPAGLLDFLATYTGMGVEVLECREPFQVGGKTAAVGGTFPLGEVPAHYFTFRVVLAGDPNLLALKKQIALKIVEQEKPAHTWYDLAPPPDRDPRFVIPQTIKVGFVSHVGQDTLLGRPGPI